MSRPTEGGVDEAEGSRLTVLRYTKPPIKIQSRDHQEAEAPPKTAP